VDTSVNGRHEPIAFASKFAQESRPWLRIFDLSLVLLRSFYWHSRELRVAATPPIPALLPLAKLVRLVPSLHRRVQRVRLTSPLAARLRRPVPVVPVAP
jgi:hypothetical protein